MIRYSNLEGFIKPQPIRGIDGIRRNDLPKVAVGVFSKHLCNDVISKLKEYIKSDGIVYGGSAGSVIFGKDINTIEVMDNNEVMLKDTIGFNLLNDISLFAHYTNYKSRLTEEENIELNEKYTKFIINYSINNGKVIAYPEEDTIFIDGDNINMVGSLPYYIFEDGVKTKIENQQTYINKLNN